MNSFESLIKYSLMDILNYKSLINNRLRRIATAYVYICVYYYSYTLQLRPSDLFVWVSELLSSVLSELGCIYIVKNMYTYYLESV